MLTEGVKKRLEAVRAKGTTFRDSRGVYSWKDERFPSVTTIIKQKAKPSLIYWSAKMVADRVADLIRQKEEGAITGSALMNALLDTDALKKSPWVFRDARREIGSAFHDVADGLATGVAIDAAVYSDDVRPLIERFQDWERRVAPETIATECMVASRKYGYAGTLDRIAVLGGDTWIIDYKSRGETYEEDALQLAAYANAEFIAVPSGEEIPMPKIDRCGILCVTDQNAVLREWDAGAETFEAFLALIKVDAFTRRRLASSAHLEEK